MMQREKSYAQNSEMTALSEFDTDSSSPPANEGGAPHVYIVLLNWNGWRDTIECLESVLRLSYPSYTVIVCDNASTDDSFEKIAAWGRGEILATAENPEMGGVVSPPIGKPLQYVAYSDCRFSEPVARGVRLVILQTGFNGGFAYGSNIGIRYALRCGDCNYVWLLNNDTVVAPDALTHMIDRMRQNPDAGMCGSTLLYYGDPNSVQTCAGKRLNLFTSAIRVVGKGRTTSDLPSIEYVEKAINYIEGASMLVRREFLEKVGLLDERYVLYWEEVDWAMRGKKLFRLLYSPLSVVYHKEGKSIGSHQNKCMRSLLSEKYIARNRILFFRKFLPWRVPLVALCVVATVLQRIWWREFSRARVMAYHSALALFTPTGKEDCPAGTLVGDSAPTAKTER